MYPMKIKEKYEQSKLAKLWHRFTVLYSWNYLPWDFNEWVWSHPWVDIFPEYPHQEVFNILSWEVIKSEETPVCWKHIVIKHEFAPDPEDLSKTTTLYSCYLHLSENTAKVWEYLDEWVLIWKTWNTGNTSWEHLHFQIDKEAPYHSYWPYTLKDTEEACVSFSEGVNLCLWLDNLKKYTINPLVYLDKVSEYRSKNNKVEILQVYEEEEDWSEIIIDNYSKSKFSDISNDDKLCPFLNELCEKWVLSLNDWKFKPDDFITRAEFLKLLLLITWRRMTLDNSDYFSDVKTWDWFKKYVNTAVWIWIIDSENDKFNPLDFVSRVEWLKMILISTEAKPEKDSEIKYSDVKKDDWFAKYVNYSDKNNLFEIVWNKFEPNKNMTRREVINIFYTLR